jgi:hypothetical protein
MKYCQLYKVLYSKIHTGGIIVKKLIVNRFAEATSLLPNGNLVHNFFTIHEASTCALLKKSQAWGRPETCEGRKIPSSTLIESPIDLCGWRNFPLPTCFGPALQLTFVTVCSAPGHLSAFDQRTFLVMLTTIWIRSRVETKNAFFHFCKNAKIMLKKDKSRNIFLRFSRKIFLKIRKRKFSFQP